MKRLLAPEQVTVARRLWAAGEPRDSIAVALGISVDTFRARLHDQLADLPQRERATNSARRGIDPTPTEIAVATARIREAWPIERFLPPEHAAARCDGSIPVEE
jgi:hypothetical protein